MKTKLALAILVATFTITVSSAQSDSASTSKRAQYSFDQLVAKGKLDLTRIYLDEVQTLNNALPYAAFPLQGQASNVKSIDIPASKYTDRKRERVSEKGVKYNSTMKESLYEIIPYTDKVDLVRAILFVQDVVNRLDKGL